ncbi:hypothetical protein Ddc_10130 [Ditylenchus destructor]|nr:hypothetical protein Ddc_10130 [Ditylenchus destructor]
MARDIQGSMERAAAWRNKTLSGDVVKALTKFISGFLRFPDDQMESRSMKGTSALGFFRAASFRDSCCSQL